MLTLTKRAPENGEILEARPEPGKEYDKYAVAGERCGDVVGHLSKGRSPKPFRIFYVEAMKTAVGLN